MIALATGTLNDNVGAPAPAFENLLPAIKRFASYSFRKVPRRHREDMLAETTANAYAAYVRLAKRGLAALIYPTALAKFAVRQVFEGRRVGSRRSARDVLSESAQFKHGFIVERLDGHNGHHQLHEPFITDRRATPGELVASKLDFHDWLNRLDRFKRQVAERLALGDTTSQAARRFGITQSRVSQVRNELLASWNAYHYAFDAA